MVRTDFLLYDSIQELGCGEVKLNCTDERLNEEDRARLGESLKKQLHYRIRRAKSTKEFYAFGIFVVDDIIELYCSSFSKEKESLEILFNFKDSQQDPLDYKIIFPFSLDLSKPRIVDNL